MSTRRTGRAIPIPPSKSTRQHGQSYFSRSDYYPFDTSNERQSLLDRSSSSPQQGSSGSSLIFAMDPEPSGHSRPRTPVLPMYDLPSSAHRPLSGIALRCSRCGRDFHPALSVQDVKDARPVCQGCHKRATLDIPYRPRTDTMVATEYIPAWHRSKAVPADISEPSPEPPRPLHHYQQWHGHTAPAPHRPIVSPMLVGQRQIGTSLPPAHPEPSSYLISQLPYLMARLEEESLVTGQGYRTWTTDVLADESPTHSSKNISLKRRDGC